MPPRIVLATLLLFGCRQEKLSPLNDFALDPPSLELSAAPGNEAHATVTLTSRSRQLLHIELSLLEPFALSAPAIELEPGERANVEVRFDPSQAGRFDAPLTASAETGTVLAQVSGNSVVACAVAPVCQVAQLDASGACTLVAAVDGTSCSLPCASAGVCAGGTCIGAALDCNDSDACTVDSCDATSGCRHTPRSCAPPSDPCRAAVCDAALGCTTVSVDDGTACGPSDCTTSRVCLSGVCQTRATPEGSRCGSYSPCQDYGSCRAQACERPPASALQPTWSSSHAGQFDIDLPGVVDSDGNLFWWEASTWNASTLVGADRDGNERYRVPLDFKPETTVGLSEPPGGVLLSGSQLLLLENSSFFDSTQARLQSRDKDTGALNWSHDFVPDERALHPCDGGGWEGVILLSPADDGASGLYVLVSRYCGNGVWAGNDVAFVDLTTGATLWRHAVALLEPSLASDGGGNVYFLEATDRLVSLDRTGAVRFVLRAAPGVSWARWRRPMAVYGDTLVTSSLDLLTLDGGADVAIDAGQLSSEQDPLIGVTPLIASGFVGLFTGERWMLSYTAFDSGGAPQWTHSFAPEGGALAAQPILTSSGSTLVITDTGGQEHLHEVSASGDELFDCPLSGSVIFGSPALRKGRLTVLNGDNSGQVQSYELPGYEPAAHGWVTAGGKMTKEGHPR